MAIEITNSLRSSTIIRIVGGGTNTLELANLSSDANETITAVKIKRILWSTNNNISISRGGNVVISLYGSGDMRMSELGHVVANNSTANISLVITGDGTSIIEFTKEATYATPLTGI